MTKRNPISFLIRTICSLSALLMFSSCDSQVTDFVRAAFPTKVTSSKPSAVTLAITNPVSDQIVSERAFNFQWTISSSTSMRVSNPFHINVYSQAACQGTPTSIADVSSSNWTTNALVDGSVLSIGVTAFDIAGNQSSQVCSPTLQGTAFVAKLQVPGAAYLVSAIDFTYKLAYLGANYGTTFFDTIDFTDEKNPTLFRSIGATSTPATPATYSRGAALYNNGQRLLVSSNGANSLELWDLTGNPRTGAWTRLSNLPGISYAR